jgi:hypothetical protein
MHPSGLNKIGGDDEMEQVWSTDGICSEN